MKIARASKEIIVVRYYPFPKMLPSIHHRLPFLDLNLRNFALQATSWVEEFSHVICAAPSPRQRSKILGPPPPASALREKKMQQSALRRDRARAIHICIADRLYSRDMNEAFLAELLGRSAR